MVFCKIIQNNDVVDVGHHFMEWIPRHQFIAYCDVNKAECIQSDIDPDRLYYANWFRPKNENIQCEDADVICIERDEYDELYDVLKDGEVVEMPLPEPEPEPMLQEEPEVQHEEKPMSVQEMRNRIAELENMLSAIMEKIK